MANLDEQKCTQKIRNLPGPTKKWPIEQIDKLNDDELDKFYCITKLNWMSVTKIC